MYMTDNENNRMSYASFGWAQLAHRITKYPYKHIVLANEIDMEDSAQRWGIPSKKTLIKIKEELDRRRGVQTTVVCNKCLATDMRDLKKDGDRLSCYHCDTGAFVVVAALADKQCPLCMEGVMQWRGRITIVD